MNNEGYIKLFRKMLEWEWYQDAAVSRVFLHLLLTANYEDKQWKGQSVKRGQRVVSSQMIADELLLSKKTAYSALKKLESTGEIRCETHSKYTIITITRFDDYQAETDEKQPAVKIVKEPLSHRSNVVDEFNKICVSLPKVETVTLNHIHMISDAKCTLRDIPFSTLFERVERSSFLTGKTPQHFMASFEWVMRAQNIEKILSGKYDDDNDTKGVMPDGRANKNGSVDGAGGFAASAGFCK